MQIIPAIDIQDSKVVRLTEGKFEDFRIYSDSPLEVAKRWQGEGATNLHLIDLDGAKGGRLSNWGVIKEILNSCSLNIQVGGGIRNKDAVKNLLDLGAHRVILGTLVKEKFNEFLELIEKFKPYIIVAVDAKSEKIVSRGWKYNTDINYIKFVKQLEDVGVQTVIFTDILRDGTLAGPNFKAIERLLDATNIPVIASGGISSINQVERLHHWCKRGLKGIILGKALYENKISLRKCIEKFGD